MLAEEKLKSIFQSTPTLSETKSKQAIISILKDKKFVPFGSGLEPAIHYVDKMAYIGTVFTKFYHMDPPLIASYKGPVVKRQDRIFYVEAVLLGWSNGFVLARRSSDQQDVVDYQTFILKKEVNWVEETKTEDLVHPAEEEPSTKQ